jgi:hypothetical protein
LGIGGDRIRHVEDPRDAGGRRVGLGRRTNGSPTGRADKSRRVIHDDIASSWVASVCGRDDGPNSGAGRVAVRWWQPVALNWPFDITRVCRGGEHGLRPGSGA